MLELHATQGYQIPGWTQLYKIADETKMMAVYRSGNRLLVGFGGTRDSISDWVSNLYPFVESQWYYEKLKPYIDESIEEITVAGHSQGGYHAEAIGNAIDATVVTFGGMPAGLNGLHYVMRRDPMRWLFWLNRRGIVKLVGPSGWPSWKYHKPEAYGEYC